MVAEAQPVSACFTTMVQIIRSQQPVDGLPYHFVNIFIVPRERILRTLVNLGLFYWHHHTFRFVLVHDQILAKLVPFSY